MTSPQFWAAVEVIIRKYGGSVTSGRRAPKHNAAVGGKDDSPHLVSLGCDVVYDDPPNQLELDALAAMFQLEVLHEGDHDHFQPADWNDRKSVYLGKGPDGGS